MCIYQYMPVRLAQSRRVFLQKIIETVVSACVLTSLEKNLHAPCQPPSHSFLSRGALLVQLQSLKLDFGSMQTQEGTQEFV